MREDEGDALQVELAFGTLLPSFLSLFYFSRLYWCEKVGSKSLNSQKLDERTYKT